MRSASAVLAALLLSAILAACSNGESESSSSAEPRTPPDEATVDQLLENPGAYDGAVVIVRGAEFVPIEPEGAFVLAGKEGRILVSAPGGVPEIEEGERVPIRGELVRFTEPAAEALGEEFADAEELAQTPTGVGDPYLLLRSLPDSDAGASSSGDDLDAGGKLADVVADPDAH